MDTSGDHARAPAAHPAWPDPGSIAPALLAWYDRNARALPWRAPPGASPAEPYRVWLAEVMLQQTTVAAAAGYYRAFLARWPDVFALAAAEEAEVMAAWAGLGYYARARHLIACARAMAARGGFPATEAELRALPGVGAYTAAAVAAIAFGQPAVVVDANVARVVARLFAITTPLPAARPAIRAGAAAITPAARPGDFAQAMMDLGATICTARVAKCGQCPLRAVCRAAALGEAGRLPIKAPKRAKPQRRGRTFWIAQEGRVWLVRRPPRAMLGGMRALPDDGWTAARDGAGPAPIDGEWRVGGEVTHGFTHCALTLAVLVYAGEARPHPPPASGEWWPVDRLAEAGLPSLYVKAAARAMAQAPGEAADA